MTERGFLHLRSPCYASSWTVLKPCVCEICIKQGVVKFWTIKSSWIHCAAWWRIQASLYCFDMAVKQKANVLCRRVDVISINKTTPLGSLFYRSWERFMTLIFYSWLSSLGGRIFVLIIFVSIFFENKLQIHRYGVFSSKNAKTS